MQSAEYDLVYLQDAVAQLEEYLLTNILYYPIGIKPPKGFPSYPKLTLGGILLARTRASVLAVSSTEKKEYNNLEENVSSIKNHWLVKWQEKAAKEFQARLTLWRNYLEDYRKNPSSEFDRYSYEVRRRVQLELLKHETGPIKLAYIELLENLDLILKSLIIPGDFIWDIDLQTGFEYDPFWYLYGQIPSNNH